tara:strand:- start:1710 stop:3104 length:1395 start_codon:yes stop_codon:yes gene_type:complete
MSTTKQIEYTKTSSVHVSADTCFKWHAAKGAFARLNPPFAPVEILEEPDELKAGAEVLIRVPTPLPFFGIKWRLTHPEYVEGEYFRDTQVKGPFKSWEHTHNFKDLDKNTSEMKDVLKFALPLGILGRIFGAPIVKKQLSALFNYRHTILNLDMETLKNNNESLNILISGSSGLIGSALIPYFTTQGHTVTRLLRSEGEKSEGIEYWDYENRTTTIDSNQKFDVVIHLGGVNLAGGRWTNKRKDQMLKSRTDSTSFLSEIITSLKTPPKVFLCASAVGIYGTTNANPRDEDSDVGNLYSSMIVDEWEKATKRVSDAGIRVVNLRFGMVLSPLGGALKKFVLPAKMGVGGKLGNGKNLISWISMEDVLGVVTHCVTNEAISGPLNVVANDMYTNKRLIQTICKVLKRPCLFPVPAFVLIFMFGKQMAKETIFVSTSVSNSKLIDSGYKFKFPELESALRHMLGKV